MKLLAVLTLFTTTQLTILSTILYFVSGHMLSENSHMHVIFCVFSSLMMFFPVFYVQEAYYCMMIKMCLELSLRC